jgi:cytochrome oxidase assembly protein ShyY1
MTRWRRPAAIVLVGLLVAATCVLLGRWQWHKHVVKDAAIAVIDASWGRPAVSIDRLTTVGRPLDPSRQWRLATLSGRYETAATVLLRGRTVDGQGVFHVLVPFLADGTVLIVDRGTVPVGSSPDAPAQVPDPPSGPVQVTVRLRAPEPAVARSAPPGQVRSTDIASVLAAAPVPVPGSAYLAVGELSGERPAATVALGPLPAPDTDPGPYLSYAFQWWAFAAMALGGFGATARREWLDPRRAEPVPRERHQGRDEAAEDAAIDAQLADGGNPQASWTRSR